MAADDASNPTPATRSEVAAAVTRPAVTPPSPTATPPQAALGGAFVKGMVWSTLALIVSKFSSLLATVCLAFVFRDRDYGAYAAARSGAMIGDVLTDGGMRRVLIARGADDYDRIARTAFRVSLGFNLAGCILMTGTATLLVRESDVASQLIVTGLALVLATFGSVQRARLATDLRFARSAFLYTVSAILRNVLTVAFAFAGLGPLSFALPVVFVAIWEAIYARRLVGSLPPIPCDVHPPSLARELIGQGKWVIFAMIGGALVARGDYLVASAFFRTPGETETDVADIAGQYMFAFQLTLGLFSPLTIGLATVIQPVMAQLRADVARQAEAFRRMVRLAIFLAVPASLVSVGITPLLLHPIKDGYWDVTAGAIQILAASECVRQLYQMSTATLEASGRFKTSAAVVAIDGILTVLAALLGCLIGGTLLSLTIAVAIQRTLTAIGEAIYTNRLHGGSTGRMLVQILPPLVIGAMIALTLGITVHAISNDASMLRWLMAGGGALAVPLFFIASYLLTPRRTREAGELVLSRFRRRG